MGRKCCRFLGGHLRNSENTVLSNNKTCFRYSCKVCNILYIKYVEDLFRLEYCIQSLLNIHVPTLLYR
jgi:hypothetical protein